MDATGDRWDRFRQLMPVARRFAYFDHAATAPLTLPAHQAILGWAAEATELGDTVWPSWERQATEVRQILAELTNASVAEIGLVANTTTGISLVAEGLDWKAGDNVVIGANEFPSNAYPWLNLRDRGVEVRLAQPQGVRLTRQDWEPWCDARTRVLALSWIGFATGWRLDLDELVEFAQSRGILVCLDAIQGLGVFPLDLRRTPIDFLAADGHKWMLGPEGAGFVYCRAEHLPRLRPLGVGWNSVVQAHDFSRIDQPLKPAASRYEGGSRNMAGLLAWRASLLLLRELGLGPDRSAIADRILDLTNAACQRIAAAGGRIISDRSPRNASGIVAFEMPGRDPNAIRRRCLEADVVLSCRQGWLRIAPHAYNNEQDLERLVACLESSRAL